MQIKINKLPQSMVEMEGEIESGVFEAYYKNALKKLGENFEMDGFRKGKAPENILTANIPEIRVLEEMAEMALAEYYPKILEENKIDAISRPEIMITKLARNNPLTFKIKTAILPEMKLPDYKKISKKIIADTTDAEKNVEVTDEDVENTIMDIRKSRAPKMHMKEPHTHEDGTVHTPTEEEKNLAPELPPFNNDFVQALGPFKDVADFTEKLRENIKLEKVNQAKEKTRLKIIEKIIEETKADLPEILIESEVGKILYKMESDITQMGLKFDEYLKHLNKTVEDLKKEFRKDGEKKAKLALILNDIAKIENIKADDEQVANEVAHILEHYKDADPERAKMHAEMVLTNEKVFNMLEKS
ncbi:MAG: trigger factor [Patescibacteria group bacterium]